MRGLGSNFIGFSQKSSDFYNEINLQVNFYNYFELPGFATDICALVEK